VGSAHPWLTPDVVGDPGRSATSALRRYTQSVPGSKTWSEPRVARLFAEPPERFVAVRNAVAAELAASGDQGAAAAVRALKRPTRRIWILNRLARELPDEVAGLLEAGAALGRAHAAAVRGKPSALREADVDMSRRLDALVRAAARAAAGAGYSTDHALLIGARTDLRTLATTGGEEAERLRSGTLDRPPSGRGGDLVGGLADALGDVAPPVKRDQRASAARAEAKEQEERAAQARKELRSAERAMAAAERELERRRAAAAKAEAIAAKLRADAEEVRRIVETERARLQKLRAASATGS
jgi:hypothetical protein